MTFSSRIRASFRIVSGSALLLASCLGAQAPAKPETTLAPAADTANPNQQITRQVQPGGVAISPDGKFVTYTVGGRRGGAIHVVAVADPAVDRVLAPPGAPQACASGNPVWSPDSATLAFLSTCVAGGKPEQEQIVLWSSTGNRFKTLTHLTGNLQQLAWSPDGKTIAFLFVENATRSAGALDAMPPWDGVIGEDHVEIQRVYGVDATSGEGSFLTPANLHVFEFSWSPHSRLITYVAANPPGENNWWVAKLYAGGTSPMKDAPPMVLFDPNTTDSALRGLQIAVPRYSPDGTKIAFIGGLMSDQGSTGGDVWVVDILKHTVTDVTPGIDGTPTFEAWTGNDNVGYIEDRRGHLLVGDSVVSTQKPDFSFDLGEVTISGGVVKNAVSVSTYGVLATVISGFNKPAEVYAGPSDRLKPITHLNAGGKTSEIRFQSVEWENEGFHVQGWLTFPAKYDEHKKYPLIVEVHGGPSASAGPRPSTAWAELGYFVFSPNPRGSFGQGEAFVQANRKDFGYGDLRDILKGMDKLEAEFPIDKHREGLTGWSYGGFMTMFGVTQTHRFRAAIAGAGLSNWQSYYGENSIDQWMVPFFGKSVYDDPAVYAKSSAINFIKNVTTPTLVIVGDRDGECPAPQSFEFWHALRAQGVTTQLVIYPNEGHGFRDPKHIADRMAREVKWFAQYMPEGK